MSSPHLQPGLSHRSEFEEGEAGNMIEQNVDVVDDVDALKVVSGSSPH
jgi:hypothetical protein